MRLLTLLFLLASISLTSCKEDAPTISLTGRLFDPVQGVFLDSVEVKIYTKKVSSGTYHFNFEYEKSVFTGPDGRFSASIPDSYISEYKFAFARNRYFDQEVELEAEAVEADGGDIGQMDLLPSGTLQIHFLNAYPANGADELRFHVTQGYHVCPDCCSNDMVIFTGMSVDQVTECRVEGGQQVVLEWFVIKNGINTPHVVNVSVPVFGVVPVEIFY